MICYIAFLIMTSRLTIQERAKIAARYEVWNSVVEVQRWWRTLKGSRATLRPETIRNCHAKLMTTGSVNDKRRSGRPSTSRSPAKVAKVQESLIRARKNQLVKQLVKVDCQGIQYLECYTKN